MAGESLATAARILMWPLGWTLLLVLAGSEARGDRSAAEAPAADRGVFFYVHDIDEGQPTIRRYRELAERAAPSNRRQRSGSSGRTRQSVWAIAG